MMKLTFKMKELFIFVLFICSFGTQANAGLEVNSFNMHGCWTNGDFQIHFNIENGLGGTVWGSSITPFQWVTHTEHNIVTYRIGVDPQAVYTAIRVGDLQEDSFIIEETLVRESGQEYRPVSVPSELRRLFRCAEPESERRDDSDLSEFSGV